MVSLYFLDFDRYDIPSIPSLQPSVSSFVVLSLYRFVKPAAYTTSVGHFELSIEFVMNDHF